MAGMSLRTQLAYLAAGLTLALGLLSLLNPLLMVRILGLEVLEPRGLSEIRATYGMLFLAMGGVMLWAIPTRPRSNPFLRSIPLELMSESNQESPAPTVIRAAGTNWTELS